MIGKLFAYVVFPFIFPFVYLRRKWVLWQCDRGLKRIKKAENDADRLKALEAFTPKLKALLDAWKPSEED